MMEEVMVSRKGFSFLRSYIESVEKLPEMVQLALLKAIIHYGLDEEIPDFSDFGETSCFLDAIFCQQRAHLDYGHMKQNAGREGGENGVGESKNRYPQAERKQNASKRKQNASNKKNKEEIEDKEEDKEEESVKEKRDKPVSPTPPKFDFKSELIALGISKQTASDFMQVRKQRKAANTQTAFNRLKAEIAKAEADGVSAEDCIRMAVENSWQGFDYEWYKNRQPKNENQPDQSERPKRIIDSRVIRLMMNGMSEKEALDRIYGPEKPKKITSSTETRQLMKKMGWE